VSIYISFCISFIRELAFVRLLSRAADLYRVLVSFERFAPISIRQSVVSFSLPSELRCFISLPNKFGKANVLGFSADARQESLPRILRRVDTLVYTMVLQKSVRVNKKSGGFLGVPWYIPWYIPWNIPWYIPSCQRAFTRAKTSSDSLPTLSTDNSAPPSTAATSAAPSVPV
jgi:hypothetical protein